MKDIGLTPHEIDLIREVFRRFPAIREVALYGSRAKGTYRPESDIDLALVGVDDDVQAEAVADELDELPLPYRFDVKAYGGIKYGPLREHIGRVGISLYQRDPPEQDEDVEATPASPLPKHTATLNLKELGYGG
ncbi:MAG: nucleotidyltransferase domain-containing protein [Deltaproteobacteria bacterium]|nr:nucleotidyltransferase domain-containing protein [Deltaproteobacteria bacterium]